MKNLMKNKALNFSFIILGIAIIVAGILTMALYHDMSWQSYVVIGCLMIAAIWALFNIPMQLEESHEPKHYHQLNK